MKGRKRGAILVSGQPVKRHFVVSNAPLHIGTTVSPLTEPEPCNKDSPTKCRRCPDETRHAGI